MKETKAELLIKVNNLEKQLTDKNQQLIDAGIIKITTFMSLIEQHEEDTILIINSIIKKCEQKTGRKLNYYSMKKESQGSNINSNTTGLKHNFWSL